MLETANLEYDDGTGLVWLKPHGDGDDSVRCGSAYTGRLAVPEEYADELEELMAMIEEAERYGAACVATASEAFIRGRF